MNPTVSSDLYQGEMMPLQGQPWNPGYPGNPGQLASPGPTGQPTSPGYPGQPGQQGPPRQPTSPGYPGQPGQQGPPRQPTSPGYPGQPGHLGYPGQPGPPGPPGYPGQPTAPAVVQYTSVSVGVEPPQDHVLWSLCCFFYGNPLCLGLVALIYSIKSRDRKVVGDLEGARHYGSTARCLNIAATIITSISIFLFIIIYSVSLANKY